MASSVHWGRFVTIVLYVIMGENIQKPFWAGSCRGMANTVPPGKRSRRSLPNGKKRNGETEKRREGDWRSEIRSRMTEDKNSKYRTAEQGTAE